MFTRMWLRLEEVQPVAEHAMASPYHRISRAQVRAGAPLGPALVWTATSDRDGLSSNGWPVWYDQDGHTHTAEAWTWKHPPTGRSGGAACPGFHTAYLPLDSTGGQPPVIDLLREGRHTGQHWVALYITAGQHLLGPDTVRLVDHRDDIAPANARWIPAAVTAPCVAHHIYPALVADGHTVRGHDVLARFDRRTVEQMVTDLTAVHDNPDRNSDPMPGEYPLLHLDGDVVVESWEHDDGHRTRLVEVDRAYPDPDGYYAVGAYLWPWTPLWQSSHQPRRRTGGCACRNARDARDPNAHNNQIHANGRCWCLCHGNSR